MPDAEDVARFEEQGYLVARGVASPEALAAMKQQLDAWIERDFDVVVPGHMPKTSREGLTARGALTHTREYLLAYDKALAESASADELIAKMISFYPDLQHQSALKLSSFIEFKETHRALFNPTLEAVASFLPSWFVKSVDAWMLERRRRAANIER